MSNPKQSTEIRPNRQARAPYNFVPLPDRVVAARQNTDGVVDLRPHDQYHEDRHTGQIVCKLTTVSPLYTRRAVDPAFAAKWANRLAELHTDEAASNEYAQFFHLDDVERPVIPGSSLRGMVRSLMEIVAHSHMRWVGKKPTIAFRAVAAPRSDPLQQPYQDIIGRFGANVRGGLLEKQGDDWFVLPSMTPADLKMAGRHGAYLKVKEEWLLGNSITGFKVFNSPEYKPNWFPVGFDLEPDRGSVRVSRIGDYGNGSKNAGLLVCSGNMLETAGGDKDSPRRNHAILLAPHPRLKKIPIDISAIVDYKESLSDYQREELNEWGGKDWGCLRDGAPIFFVDEVDEQSQPIVRYFGHSPNFRILARLDDTTRASNPFDFVPAELYAGETPDLTEGIFGWVQEEDRGLQGQRAGRVFFEDAQYTGNEGAGNGDGPWLSDTPVTLATLSTPKPTTFQHYLVQDRNKGHDPNNSATLAHFGTSTQETQIRGYKRYWHKGPSPQIKATDKELQHPKQLTRVRPLKPGVEFEFTVRFDNLSSQELGALLWVLTLPGEEGKEYCHKLGMGKPLGMGAVSIDAALHLDKRPERYTGLFDGDQWLQPRIAANIEPYMASFETYVLQALGVEESHLSDLSRIRTLLTLLEWREGGAGWQEMTRYQEIERGSAKTNEYKERPVLPDARKVSEAFER